MKVTLVGTGYVGLTSGVCLAELGHSVTCVDNNATKIAQLNRGNSTIFEANLIPLLQKNLANKQLTFTNSPQDCIPYAEIIIIAVDTPTHPTGGHANLQQLHTAIDTITPFLQHDCTIVIKSTVPVGTTDAIATRIATARPELDFHAAFNPEFLREGSAVQDFLQPDRIVIGTDSTTAYTQLTQLYQPLTQTNIALIRTSTRSAELSKYAANALLASKLALVNEIADLCEAYHANITELTKAVGLDHRIGPHHLTAGPGFGGSCFPKDMRALQHLAHNANVDLELVDATLRSNQQRIAHMVEKIVTACNGVDGKQIALLGLAFKANTDDVRCSPALTIATKLLAHGANIHAYDPQAMHNAQQALPTVTYHNNAEDALQQADAAVIATEWPEFAQLNLAKLPHIMKTPLLIDLRNLYQPHDIARHNIRYISIGRAEA